MQHSALKSHISSSVLGSRGSSCLEPKFAKVRIRRKSENGVSTGCSFVGPNRCARTPHSASFYFWVSSPKNRIDVKWDVDCVACLLFVAQADDDDEEEWEAEEEEAEEWEAEEWEEEEGETPAPNNPDGGANTVAPEQPDPVTSEPTAPEPAAPEPTVAPPDPDSEEEDTPPVIYR